MYTHMYRGTPKNTHSAKPGDSKINTALSLSLHLCLCVDQWVGGWCDRVRKGTVCTFVCMSLCVCLDLFFSISLNSVSGMG